MGKLSLTLIVVGTAACGSDANKTPDATIVVPDTRPIDAPKVFMDAPPPSYDFTCYNGTFPTTAPANITISGTAETVSGMAQAPVASVTIDAYKTGNNTSLSTKTSAADGTFTTDSIATGGTPITGYLRAVKTGYRTTYVYPPAALSKATNNTPVPMISTATFIQLNALLSQNDTNNGLFIVSVSDCAGTPINGATLTVKQNNAEVGTQTDLGQLSSAFAGIYAVANVPDGDATVSGSYNAMTFPTHTATAYKQPAGADSVGTITETAVLPGPI